MPKRKPFPYTATAGIGEMIQRGLDFETIHRACQVEWMRMASILAENFIGKHIWCREGKDKGIITNCSSPCRLEGCNGIRLHVKWENGKRTYPCSMGVGDRPDGDYQIGLLSTGNCIQEPRQ